MNDDLQFLCLGSGSSGNCYLLGFNNQFIMVECGLPYKTIIKKMAEHDISIDQVKALVVSHCHKDHALSIEEFRAFGITVYAPYEQSDGRQENVDLTDWCKVHSFKVEHDTDCYGFAFLFLNKAYDSVLFVTDTKYIDNEIFNYRFSYIMVECNHIRKQLEAIMDKALIEGNAAKVFKFKRQASFHLSLAGVKKMLNRMKLMQVKAIFLMHLSKECCNDDLVKKEIYDKYKVPTFVCYRQGGIN